MDHHGRRHSFSSQVVEENWGSDDDKDVGRPADFSNIQDGQNGNNGRASSGNDQDEDDNDDEEEEEDVDNNEHSIEYYEEILARLAELKVFNAKVQKENAETQNKLQKFERWYQQQNHNELPRRVSPSPTPPSSDPEEEEDAAVATDSAAGLKSETRTSIA